MKNKIILSTIIATIYTVPCDASTIDHYINNITLAKNDPPLGQVTKENAQEKIIFTISEQRHGVVQCSIMGNPNVYYKVLYGLSEGERLETLTNGDGNLGKSGVAIIDIEFEKYNSPKLYLKIIASATAGFNGNVRASEIIEIFKNESGEISSNCSGNICIKPSEASTTEISKSRGWAGGPKPTWYSRE